MSLYVPLLPKKCLNRNVGRKIEIVSNIFTKDWWRANILTSICITRLKIYFTVKWKSYGCNFRSTPDSNAWQHIKRKLEKGGSGWVIENIILKRVFIKTILEMKRKLTSLLMAVWNPFECQIPSFSSPPVPPYFFVTDNGNFYSIFFFFFFLLENNKIIACVHGHGSKHKLSQNFWHCFYSWGKEGGDQLLLNKEYK